MVYTTGVAVQVYFDNMVVVQKNESEFKSLTSLRSGHIVLGRYYENSGSPNLLWETDRWLADDLGPTTDGGRT